MRGGGAGKEGGCAPVEVARDFVGGQVLHKYGVFESNLTEEHERTATDTGRQHARTRESPLSLINATPPLPAFCPARVRWSLRHGWGEGRAIRQRGQWALSANRQEQPTQQTNIQHTCTC